jgi:hypothetical protein
MRKGDVQYAYPNTLFVAAKVAIEALTGVPTGSEAYANDNPTAPYGTFNGLTWDWQPLASHAAVTLSVAAEVLLKLNTQEIDLDTQAANTVFAGRADRRLRRRSALWSRRIFPRWPTLQTRQATALPTVEKTRRGRKSAGWRWRIRGRGRRLFCKTKV